MKEVRDNLLKTVAEVQLFITLLLSIVLQATDKALSADTLSEGSCKKTQKSDVIPYATVCEFASFHDIVSFPRARIEFVGLSPRRHHIGRLVLCDADPLLRLQ